MQNVLFLKNKIARQITLNGQTFVFTRRDEDEYHQQLETEIEIATVSGIFHETTSFVRETSSDSGRMISKPQPMILILCDEESEKIQKNDKVVIGSESYHVIKKHDVKGLKVAYDISLEVVV